MCVCHLRQTDTDEAEDREFKYSDVDDLSLMNEYNVLESGTATKSTANTKKAKSLWAGWREGGLRDTHGHVTTVVREHFGGKLK